MNELNYRRLLMIRHLLDELTFYTDEEVSEEERDALCININEFCLYPSFQFNDDTQIIEQLRNCLSNLRMGRDDIDVIAWLLSEKTVLIEKAVAPVELVQEALDVGDFEVHDRLVSAEASQSRYLTAKPVDLLGSEQFDVFVDDWKSFDDRVIPTKDIVI
ncbi:hypothetical protein BCV09_09270 [Vibrio cyclitrophicus]|uniref:hypothetical protein n=1 Tax=Vibrio cyclitrophicus TaxID=47951 RepID=UPI001F53C2E4|nr:hypothetical protein [Vibrio cyclitrophicus]